MSGQINFHQIQKENKILRHKIERLERSRELLEARWDRTSSLFQTLHEEIAQTNQELNKAREAAEAAARAKSAFLANMSHEIRTPMNAVLGFTQLMLRDGSITPGQRQRLKAISSAGDHLLYLIDEILQLAKLESGRLTLNETTFDLVNLLDDLVSVLQVRADSKGLRLLVEQVGGVPRYVKSDEAKFRQVLSNLVGNAIKFTVQGGVAVRVAVRDSTNGPILIVEVEDTGPGIAAEEIPRLFQKFEQTKSGRRSKQGTGLGLAICSEIAQLMEGAVTVSSQVGKGSIFRLEIPLKAGNAADVQKKDDARQVKNLAEGQPAARVLVADDKKDNRTFVTSLLEAVGFETREAANGEEAVEVFVDWQPCLVLMDMRMPVVDGVEAIRRIRKAIGGGAVKIIAVTASAFEEDLRDAKDAGADDIVSKPFRENTLFEKIQALLGVEYDYVEERDTVVTAVPESDADLSPQIVAMLPADLRQQLRQATLSGDRDTVFALLEQAEVHEATVARGLRTLTESFAYQQILDLLITEEEVV